jgi:hypothetical protein
VALTRRAVILCAVFLLAVTAVRFAQPILDGDLFWQMAYARQMLERHTLILDHITFSWTPASNRMIYCAWVSELFLYGLWNLAGLAGLFAFRYLCVAVVLALAWSYARRLGLASAPFTWLLLVILLLGTFGGTIIKPEIFSLLFFNLLVWLFFQFRLDGRVRWLYLVPLCLLVWVNTHGAFIIAAPFFLVAPIGEALERRLSRHMLAAWALCGAALFANPYGWRYPWQLIENHVLGRTPRPDTAWNDAHLSIFSPGASGGHFIELLAWMTAILVLLALRKRKFDWTIALANAVYVPFFMIYLRTTFFWPVVFCYSALYLAHMPPRMAIPWQRYAKPAALALFLFLGGRAMLDSLRHPDHGSWLGFGIGYTNPVPEAEFLASAGLGNRLYNTFGDGGYLLWRLYPQYRVMTDSRSFPYLAWFSDQYKFSMGTSFDDFLRRYPADVASIELSHAYACRNFLRSPDWRLVFYGPTSAVFIRRSLPFEGQWKSAGTGIRNAAIAVRFFYFAAEVGDFNVAWSTLEHIETQLTDQIAADDLAAVRAYREGQRALRSGDWTRAGTMFDIAFARKSPGERDQLVRIFLHDIELLRAAGRAGETGTFEAALKKLAAPE